MAGWSLVVEMLQVWLESRLLWPYQQDGCCVPQIQFDEKARSKSKTINKGIVSDDSITSDCRFWWFWPGGA